MLKHLLTRGPDCPKVIATTHFHDVFHNDLLDPYKLPITFVHMQVLLAFDSNSTSSRRAGSLEEEDGPAIAPGEKITYLYKYVTPFSNRNPSLISACPCRVANGYSLHSHAITCAELFGVPKRVTSRAKYVR